MPTTYEVGDLVRITGTWTDADDVVTDPNTVLAQHTDPSGNEVSLTTTTGITKDSTGVYYFDLDLDEEGHWPYRFYAQASGDSSAQGAASSWLIAKAYN
jgi:hypothetical protein